MIRRRHLAAAAALTLIAVGAAAPAAQAAATPTWHKGVPPLATPWTDEVGPNNALPEYPRPQLVRDRWQNLNGVWEFAKADVNQAVPAGQSLGERVLVPYPIESALSGIQRHEDRMWYRRTFTVPANWEIDRGQHLMLHFGAVDYDAKVYVNGTQVATHRGGYDGFDIDVTGALKGTGPQELIVWAEDLTDATGQPIGKQRRQSDHGIFYQGSSGIWRTVWMEPVAATGITDLKQTPDVPGNALKLTTNVTGGGQGLTVEAVARKKGKVVGTVTGPAGTELRLPVPKAKLWSPDDPFLYDLEVTLKNGGTTVDEVESYFGMREIGTKKGADGKLRIALNGKILFNMATLDQGFWPDGLNTAPTDEGLKFDLEQHKEMGFNAVRKHIKVEPDRWYYWADKLGLLVWQDMPAANTGPIPEQWRGQFESELHEMVREHQSWTSIIAWIPFNEGWGEWDRTATGRIADEVKAQDPSRLVNAHSGVNCCNSHGDSGRGDVIDHHQYLGPATPSPDATRVSIDGEHGGFGLKVSNHMWFGDGQAYEMEPDSETLTAKYVANQKAVITSAQSCGISAAIYTQITDVEGELNGFWTYDRQVAKMDLKQVKKVNKEIIKKADGSAGNTPQPPAGTPGLNGVAAYPLNGTTEDTAGDHDATLVGGPAYGDGKNGQGLVLNGSSQYADTGAPILNTASDYTASAWVKLDKADGAFQTVVSQDGAGNSDFFLQYSGADQRFAMSFAGVRALAPAKPNVGQWYHLVGVRDSVKGELRLYVDGEPAGSVSACQPQAAPTGNTVIGRGKYGGNPVDYLDGTVDQVHLFDRALSATEIKELYTSGS
ncbi:LamG-like jellyroll fold domain-containing protein [Actinoplanes sp. N902-109]|uniref:LamG-like jellyroll fold domain-containing protein n=1 Tax=Actinoplanes sp. (strain N902-109) TaxID=649831 RepID=UPI000329595E|nr:LamG-like jellyroll fold domain-containing protein [Actinoplanes sp. N902-109]AGL18759.1 glycoside hydrolase family protein [Actinoplanes sp. N902-109]